jgi:membrane protein DedA with SNARE-associated domain
MWSHELIARYGVLVVFLNVFGSSLGLPLPAAPTLVMVGAGISLATGSLSSSFAQFGALVGAAVIGGALGDFVWFQGGKHYGERTLQGVCKLLMPRTRGIGHLERFFGRWGVRVLIIARFVPGLALVSVPLCGAMAVRWRSFILHDCVGLGLWATVALAIGVAFASQIDRTVALLWRFGGQALIVIAAMLALYLSYRYFRHVRCASVRGKSCVDVNAADEALAGRITSSLNSAYSAHSALPGEQAALAASSQTPRMTTNETCTRTWNAIVRSGRRFPAIHVPMKYRRRGWRGA